MILLIDNYDSFTWNLVQRLGELDPAMEIGRDLLVVRNDRITPDDADRLDSGRGPSHVIISPGPCTPSEAGVSSAIIDRFAGRVPVLGVCLGHQCIGALHGMTVTRHAVPMHGKTSPIHHDGTGLYAGLPNPFTATRYHSLVVLAETIPPPTDAGGWAVSAWTDEAVTGPVVGPTLRVGLHASGTPMAVQSDSHGAQPSPRRGRGSGPATPFSQGAPAAEPRTRRVVMGLRRVWSDAGRSPLEGVQFHPESFLTEEGPRLLANFLRMGRKGGVS